MASADLDAIVEFVMPADEIQWDYNLYIRADAPFFGGTTSVLVDNVTQGETLLTLTETTPGTLVTLSATRGDIIRLTTAMHGFGSMGPGSAKSYVARLSMIFLPEPASVVMLSTAIACVLSCRRLHCRTRKRA